MQGGVMVTLLVMLRAFLDWIRKLVLTFNVKGCIRDIENQVGTLLHVVQDIERAYQLKILVDNFNKVIAEKNWDLRHAVSAAQKIHFFSVDYRKHLVAIDSRNEPALLCAIRLEYCSEDLLTNLSSRQSERLGELGLTEIQ